MALDLSKYKQQNKPANQNIGGLVIPTSKPHEAAPQVLRPIQPVSIPLAQTRQQANNIIPNIITAWNADGSSKDITLNAKQHEFASLLANGLSCVLIGAAGTGKTTCTQAGIAALMQTGNVLHIQDSSHKYIKSGAPGLLVTSYTRRAVQNIKRQMPLDIAANTITIHKSLEYSPVFYEVMDDETGKMRNKRVFEPKRNLLNPLCGNIQTVIIDEASMLSVELFDELRQALPTNCQFCFIGDLNQLPPVFGHAILGYKLLELPVIELTEVYRQALESPIIRLAHRILSGKPIMQFEMSAFCEAGKLQIIPYPKQLDSEHAMLETCKMFYAGYDSGSYNPDTDIILCPQVNDKTDKKFNCTLINKYIGNHIARREGRVTHEIIASFHKLYYSVGDKVIYDKQDATIVDIRLNESYLGSEFQAPSQHLDYFGHNEHEAFKLIQNTDIDIDKLIEDATYSIEEGAKLAASHIVTIELTDSHNDEFIKLELKTVGELLAIDLAYAMTIHKSQGSEWRKVFLLFHKSHNNMLCRELLYTAVTRARETLVMVCEKDSLIKGITKQKIKGNTLAEKAEYFKGKIASNQANTSNQ
jgi:exodeoxyribonuclease V alpha subunit